MKLTMTRISQGEDEVIIRYHRMNGQIEAIAWMVQGTGARLSALGDDGQILLLLPEDILYLESVDGATWAYLAGKVCRVRAGLGEAAACYLLGIPLARVLGKSLGFQERLEAR